MSVTLESQAQPRVTREAFEARVNDCCSFLSSLARDASTGKTKSAAVVPKKLLLESQSVINSCISLFSSGNYSMILSMSKHLFSSLAYYAPTGETTLVRVVRKEWQWKSRSVSYSQVLLWALRNGSRFENMS